MERQVGKLERRTSRRKVEVKQELEKKGLFRRKHEEMLNIAKQE